MDDSSPIMPDDYSGSERPIGPETARVHSERIANGFYDKYLSGDHVLDIGFRGGRPDAVPVTDKAIGVELDYPGYDGRTLPFPDGSQDAVFVSHCLEHIDDYRSVIADWFRVLRIGGYLVISVPHQHLYERKPILPSRFNGDHKRMYTPQSLLREIDESVPFAEYRLRSLRDNDRGCDYGRDVTLHPVGIYEIELVIEKIARPPFATYLGWDKIARHRTKMVAEMLRELAHAQDHGLETEIAMLSKALRSAGLVPWFVLKRELAEIPLERLRALIEPFMDTLPIDGDWYLEHYRDLSEIDPVHHFTHFGYFENRPANGGDLTIGY